MAAQIKAQGDNGRSGNEAQKERVRRPWHHYLLLWPIVLDKDKHRRNGRLFTAREWVGWAIVVLVIVLAVAFT
ncbi:hypothetical protein HNQ60_001217 [Povalibacter uvarum]|uniref:Uncharacterized protein n=1 Tax=Povalibacter uvarum TaxID=732238 RepID=A0A841HGV9_9GAMM|nr:hypothetical protein [Povalibacter uvarum]